MSTKTTLKRIALVAVSALGFGLMTSVAPANAGTVYTTSISATTNKAPVAGVNGDDVVHTIRFQSATTASSLTAAPRVSLTSKPSGSTMALQAITETSLTPGEAELSKSATLGDTNTDELNANSKSVEFTQEGGYTYYTALAYLHAHYDVAGTYVWTIWDDSDANTGTVNGTEVSTTFTVVVGGTGSTQTYTATTTGWGLSSFEDGDNGALVRIALKDSAGNAASPDTAGGVKVSLSGSAKVTRVNQTSDVTDSATYILGSGDFDGDGYAWVNIIDGTAETVTMTLSGSGSMASSFTAPSAVAITFGTAVASTNAPLFKLGAASGLKSVTAMAATTNGSLQINKTSTSVTLQTQNASATPAAKDKVIITDTNGVITGKSAAKYDILVTEGDSDTCTYCGTFSISGINFGGLTDKSFRVANKDGYYVDITSKTAEATTVTVASADNFKAAAGAVHSFAVTVKNQFGALMSGTAVTASIAGRNATVNVASAVTNADGVATLTYTDASTSTTSLTDTVTFSSNSNTDTATITYTSAANYGASTILLTTAKTKTTGADADVLSTMYWDIYGGSTLDGVEGGIQAVTATVKDSGAVVLAGVPVTFTVTGTGCAILSTKKTVYTGATGTASTSVYAWLEGKCVVTGTVGTVTDDVNTYWSQQTAEEVRTFTATNSSPRVITVTAKDRFGNLVYNAPFTATITKGDGFFGTGTNVASGNTDAAGVLKFNTLESETDLTVQIQAGGLATYGQTDASATLVASNTSTDVFLAYTAGTALEAEEGVGSDAAYTAAGVNIVNVTVAATKSAAAVAAEAASDAAAEAIDAANAATDAANLAAEAADAATVAAEEARDAADAATAAVEELATQVATLMAALKAQITTLANTVAKIAKKVKA